MSSLKRRKTREVRVGDVIVGGNAPVSVQTMTKAPAGDVSATLEQIRDAADAGCDIIRCAVPSGASVEAFAAVVQESPLPVVADIHFDWRIAVKAIRAGAAKVRINPGNMADWDGIGEVVRAAANAGIPIRIGVNSGSVKHKNAQDGRSIPDALAEEALSYAERFESLGFRDIVLSLKSGDVMETIAANRAVASQCDYPLHLGVTAAGPLEEALMKSAVGIGALLADRIGDTIRLSFTGPPIDEVVAGRQLLRAAGLLADGPTLMSCPTCGRCRVDLRALVSEVQKRLDGIRAPLTIAVMGCEVNGPGEAREADVGIASAGNKMTLFVAGESIRTVPSEDAVEALMQEVKRMNDAWETGHDT